MTAKQERFVAEYLIDLNATQAAIRAGYSEKFANTNANKLLQNTTLKNAINVGLEKINSEKIADAAEVMQYLTSVMRGETEAEIVVIENVGDFCSEARRMNKSPDEKERLKAAELLGKRYSLFNDKVNIEGVVPVIITGADSLER